MPIVVFKQLFCGPSLWLHLWAMPKVANIISKHNTLIFYSDF